MYRQKLLSQYVKEPFPELLNVRRGGSIAQWNCDVNGLEPFLLPLQ
jgi:hypothetical protein